MAQFTLPELESARFQAGKVVADALNTLLGAHDTLAGDVDTLESTVSGHTSALGAVQTQANENTGYGVASGLAVSAQSTPNMTVKVAAGVAYLPDGTRVAVAGNNVTVPAASSASARKDIVYVAANGALACLSGEPLAPAIAGLRKVTIVTNAVAGDTFTFGDITLTAVASNPGANQFTFGATAADTMTSLAGFLEGAITVNGDYVVAVVEGAIHITEKVAGGGNTPPAVTVTGTMTITQELTASSKAAVEEVVAPATPTNCVLLALVTVGQSATSVGASDIADKRKGVLVPVLVDASTNKTYKLVVTSGTLGIEEI
ncbi:MAG: hypothetical protein BWY57_03557 [Betaproteobacteria bacterium ADurb.Bin341]|nr:MAG: hypothetical protein BWY57_03557 [Betaproteobacteria bacterium ADurb.Bin341]